MLGGTASEASKSFTDHTFQIGCDYTQLHSKNAITLFKNITTGVPTVHRNFQKFKGRRGLSELLKGAPAPKPPGYAIPESVEKANHTYSDVRM